MNAKVELTQMTPAQDAAYQKLERVLSVSNVIALMGASGSGKTTILKTLAGKHDGQLINMQDVVDAVSVRDASAWDDAVRTVITKALEQSDLVIIDDFGRLAGLGGNSINRGGYFNHIAMKQIIDSLAASGKHLVLCGRQPSAWEQPSDIYTEQAAAVAIPVFGIEDYNAIAVNTLGAERVANVDFKMLYKYASLLHAYQLNLVFSLLTKEKEITTDKTIEYLENFVLQSNTRTAEVEHITFDQLPGAEHIVEALETNIVLPLENRQLAMDLGLKPKRGVLLYGPPGTGKTSIGRALAHRMKGKFFLIDGSFTSEPPQAFFSRVSKVVEDAKENSPSVLFIDDADVLFKIEHIAGLARYLLTLLDGLESETSSNVCVMMTAMNVKLVPEALLRSGRVELWLETIPPTEQTRGRILQRWMGNELPDYDKIDYAPLAKATASFTPADLRRIAGDAKSLYAADLVAKRKPATAEEYLLRAIDTIIAVRNRMAECLNDDSLRVIERVGKSKYAQGVGGSAETGSCSTSGW